MKKIIIASLLFLTASSFSSIAQETTEQASSNGEKHGKTLNLGVGFAGYAGYYKYVGRTVPVFNLNYEFDIVKNFTIAPFISVSSHTNSYYWGNHNYPYQYYTYRETVIPIGAKGTYYFDNLLKASSKWDFYLAGSVGFVFINSSWDDNYYGDQNYYKPGNPLFLDLHIGAEYHFNSHLGAYLNLSTGVSTIGIAFH